MTDIESLRRLTEAVETAGADIAPTYLEYVQLSFAKIGRASCRERV